MQVSVRLMCADMDVPSGSREVVLAVGATIGQAIAAYRERYAVDDPEGMLPESMFLVDRKPAQLDTVLRENDELLVVRLLHGG